MATEEVVVSKSHFPLENYTKKLDLQFFCPLETENERNSFLFTCEINILSSFHRTNLSSTFVLSTNNSFVAIFVIIDNEWLTRLIFPTNTIKWSVG